MHQILFPLDESLLERVNLLDELKGRRIVAGKFAPSENQAGEVGQYIFFSTLQLHSQNRKMKNSICSVYDCSPVHIQRVLNLVLQRPDPVPLRQEIALKAKDFFTHLLSFLAAAVQGDLEERDNSHMNYNGHAEMYAAKQLSPEFMP